METPTPSHPPSWHLHRVFMNSISDDSAYVFQILPLLNSSLLAVSSSDNVIKLYDANLSPVGQLAGHTSTINEVVQSEVDHNFLYSISADSSIRCWDVRTRGQVGQLGGARVGNAEGFCLGHTQHLLAAGMGSAVYLWDLRNLGNGLPMRSYTDMHTDDVTQAKFRGGTLVTGSMDGTVCFWDTQTDDEDNQLLNVLPIDESVSLIGFFGAQLEHLYCLTHSERLSLWNAATIDRLRDFSDIREKVSAITPLDYLVGCHFEPATQQLLVVGGSFNGDVVVMQVTEGGITPSYRFAGGHSAVIRSFYWNAAANLIVTGGEDSRLCLWGPIPPAQPPSIPSPARDGKVARKDGKKAAFKPY